MASKAAEHAARLAAVLTLFDDPCAVAVTGETMADAVTLATYYVNEAARLAEAATVSSETAEAEKLRRWLVESWGELCISVRAVVRRGPNSLREAKKARAALAMLDGVGAVVKVEGGADAFSGGSMRTASAEP